MDYYVYLCTVDGEVKYVGMGKGDRISHCTSGKSSCRELNRDYFQGKSIVASKVQIELTQEEALAKEHEMIKAFGLSSLYNRNFGKASFGGTIGRMLSLVAELVIKLPDSITEFKLQHLLNRISRKYHYPIREITDREPMLSLMKILGYSMEETSGIPKYHRKESVDLSSVEARIKLTFQ